MGYTIEELEAQIAILQAEVAEDYEYYETLSILQDELYYLRRQAGLLTDED